MDDKEYTGNEVGLSGDNQVEIAVKEIFRLGGNAEMKQLYTALEIKMNGKKLSKQGKANFRTYVNKHAVEAGLIYPHEKGIYRWFLTPYGKEFAQKVTGDKIAINTDIDKKEVSTTQKKNGKTLNKNWDVNAKHALYRKNGTWYHHLKKFPGALFDENGYILFQTEQEYRNCEYLQLGKQLSVPHGISSTPNYVRVINDIENAFDLTEPAPRVNCTVNRIVRNTALSHKVKRLYQDQCQICKFTLQLYNGKTYAEAHHIKPLGAAHNGPDVMKNIVCVCPNCHAQLDFGGIEIDKSILLISAGHSISDEYIAYHNSRIYKGSKAQN